MAKINSKAVSKSEAQRFARRLWAMQVRVNGTDFIPPKQLSLYLTAYEKAARAPDSGEYEAIKHLAAYCLRWRKPMPAWLVRFAADALEAKGKPARKRGRDRYGNWGRDFKLWWMVGEVASKFDLPHYTRNEEAKQPTAASVVADAADLPENIVIKAYRRMERMHRAQSLGAAKRG